MNFSTANQSLRQILGNGMTYAVPRFQRDFSWTQDEWDDLWQDIQGTVEEGGDPAHYMGYLVLQTRDNKQFEIIDGQQRLTTLSLLALAVIGGLEALVSAGTEAENNRIRAQQFRNTFIGYLDPVTLVPRSKLRLNRNNDGYYQDHIVPLQKLPQRGLRASEQLLRRAFEWFRAKVADTYRDGQDLARFLDTMSDRLFFTVITVTDELNAFKVFETLNSRGVRLSPADLLKNYLFSVVARETSHAHDIDTLERRWDDMVQVLGGDSLPDFLRAHWNSRRRFVREADLFKTIRAGTPNRGAVFELVRQMEEDIGLYTALSRPEDPLWSKDDRRYVQALRHFSVRQPWPLLMAAHRRFDAAGFSEILRACMVITFRSNVIAGLASNEQERVYSAVVQRIAGEELVTTGDIIRALAPVYVPDEQFRAAFTERTLRTTAPRNYRVARYILIQIERHLTGIEHDADNPATTLEHVLPEKPGENWPDFETDPTVETAYRLGNLTLLEANLNRKIGNAAFAVKQPVLAVSAFDMSRRIAAENAEWTIERLANRQRWMAQQAAAIWRIAQLDGRG